MLLDCLKNRLLGCSEDRFYLDEGDTESTGVSVEENSIYKIYATDGGGPSLQVASLEATVFGGYDGNHDIKLIHHLNGILDVEVVSNEIYISNSDNYRVVQWYVEKKL